MIEGEIKVGDRLICRPQPMRHEVLSIDKDCGLIEISRPGTTPYRASDSAIRSVYEREVAGWTPITPETLPGVDVALIFATNGLRIVEFAKAGMSWDDLASRGESMYVPWTHWRPVPDDWLPLPKHEGETK